MKRSLTLGRREAIGALALALGAIVIRPVRPALAQQKLVLKASDVHPAGYPTVAAVESLGRKLQQATAGRLSVQMYGSMQLGGEKEAIEQAQVGAIQFARVSVGALGPVIDDLNVFNLPFLFRNTAHMQKVIDGPIGDELLEKVTGNARAGLVGICWMDAGARSIYDTRRAIKSIDDLKGLKVRVMGNPMFVDMMNTLSGEDREVLKKFGREAQAEERVLWNQYEKQALEKAKAAGIQIIEIADKKPFQDAVKPVWDKYGPKYAEIIKRIQAVE